MKVVGETVTSDFTAQSAISGGPAGQSSKNSTAAAVVQGLVRTGAAETTTTATKSASSTTIRSWARTTGIELLGGLVSASAVETDVSTVGNTDGSSSFAGNTQLVGIHVSGADCR